MEIRINPERKGGPIVSSFIVMDRDSRKSETITWQRFNDKVVDNIHLTSMTITEFYTFCLKHVLKSEEHYKFFSCNRKIS